MVGVGTGSAGPRPSSRSTPCRHRPPRPKTGALPRGSTSIDFGENQLSPGLIGLSPLPTSHPNGFQPIPVRPSTGCYPSFSLLMGRSPWLRVYPRALLRALVAGLAFALAPRHRRLAPRARRNSPDHNAKGTQSGATRLAPVRPPTACRPVVSGSLSLPARGCFSPVPHGTRPLSVTRESLALEGGPPCFPPGSSCRAVLRHTTSRRTSRSATGLSPSRAPRSRGLRVASRQPSVGPTTPVPQGDRFGLRPFRSPLLRASRLDFSSSGY